MPTALVRCVHRRNPAKSRGSSSVLTVINNPSALLSTPLVQSVQLSFQGWLCIGFNHLAKMKVRLTLTNTTCITDLAIDFLQYV